MRIARGRGRRIGKVRYPTQRFIIGHLNGLDREMKTTAELREFYGWSRDVWQIIKKDLEDFGLAKVDWIRNQQSHSTEVIWSCDGRELWNKAFPVMSPPVSKLKHALRPDDMSNFTPSGETLLAARSPFFIYRKKPIFAHLKPSSNDNYQRVTPCSCADPNAIDVQFWHYPPLYPGKTEIDNLTLYLALGCTIREDRTALMYRWILLDTHPWKVKGLRKHYIMPGLEEAFSH